MTVSSASVPPEWDMQAIASRAGNGAVSDRYYRDGALYVVGVEQVALDAAVAEISDAGGGLVAPRLLANNAAYEQATSAMTANYPQLEKDTWPTQDAESRAWLDDPLAPTPWVDRAAAVRGIGREEYLRRTLLKARQFVIMSAWLTGRRQGYEDAIKAGSDPALDYNLPLDVQLELAQLQETVMTTPSAQLKEALA